MSEVFFYLYDIFIGREIAGIIQIFKTCILAFMAPARNCINLYLAYRLSCNYLMKY